MTNLDRVRSSVRARRPGAWLAALALAASALLGARTARAAHVILEWTAPGDDGMVGQAVEYDLRWSVHGSQFPTRFYAAPRIPLLAPGPSGSIEHVIVSNLPKDVGVFFALKTRDKFGNWSSISNVLAAQYVADVASNENALDFAPLGQNPAHGPTQFSLQLPQTGSVLVDAVDVQGRRVATLQNGPLAAGRHTIAWSLRDADGNAIRSGVYFIRAHVAGTTFVHRLVVVR